MYVGRSVTNDQCYVFLVFSADRIFIDQIKIWYQTGKVG